MFFLSPTQVCAFSLCLVCWLVGLRVAGRDPQRVGWSVNSEAIPRLINGQTKHLLHGIFAVATK